MSSLFSSSGDSFAATGTTSPIFVPRDGEAEEIHPGECYFYVKIAGAQAAYNGRFWEQALQLIVTSQVALNHPALGPEPFSAIQRYRPVERRQAERLGLSPNLISIVPATMSHVSISIDFLVDKRNRLVDLGNLINDDAFLTALSLAPGAVAVARTIGALSQKLIQTFLQAEERQPILQFGGDFNLAAGDLRPGYFIVLGTRDADNPLPSSQPVLAVQDGVLLADSRPVTQLSYVIFDVRTLPVRTRAMNEGAPWADKLRQAEGVALRIEGNPLVEDSERKQAWNECKTLIKEAQLLLLSDPNYLAREARDIIKASFDQCFTTIFPPTEATAEALAIRDDFLTLESEEVVDYLEFVGLDPREDLRGAVADYKAQVAQAETILEADPGLAPGE